MKFFSNITPVDRIEFEGSEVREITPVPDRDQSAVTKYNLTVLKPGGEIQVRTFAGDEIQHLIEEEKLIVEREFYSVARQIDRALYGGKEVFGATKKRRRMIDRKVFLAQNMGQFRKLGMVLTRDGVDPFRHRLEKSYKDFQAQSYFGTDKANSTQSLKPLPENCTLLDGYRIYRKSNGNPNAFLPKDVQPANLSDQETADYAFVTSFLAEYASGTTISKGDVAETALDEILKENARRAEVGFPAPIPVRSVRQYERYIDERLDPFEVMMQREGLQPAIAEFGSVEEGQKASFPGEKISLDAWNFHIVTLDATRDQLNRMTKEQRAGVKRVRRWVVVAIDIATRVILGYSICRHPNSRSSREALRMCFMDKTYILRNAGIKKSDWKFRCPVHLVTTDSGSEFGKHPFGGAEFAVAVRKLSGSFMNTTAGVPQLRGHKERWYLTAELKFARHVPGWVASNPQKLNDRKPYDEACLADDELDAAFASFIADYHTSPHRGLNGKTPATAWEEKMKHDEFDFDQLPGPKALREACGFHVDAAVTKTGIQFCGLSYSNEFLRESRSGPVSQRIAANGDKAEIMVDPFDLGAISVLVKGDMISVPCIDPEMRGKSLRDHQRDQQRQRWEAAMDAEGTKEQRLEARKNWKSLVNTVAKSSDIGMIGYTEGEVARASMELRFGKGQHEKPFVGREEYVDPVYGGFDIGGDDTAAVADENEVFPDAPNSMDRFRTKVKPRAGGNGWEEGE